MGEERKIVSSGVYDVEQFYYDYEMYPDDFEEVSLH
jgi:hypothetical protein